jgi:predicted transcriptional regulator
MKKQHMKTQLILFFCVALAPLLGFAQNNPVGKPAPGFTLEDQFDKKTEVKFPPKQPTFLLFSDRNQEGAKQADRWGQELVGEYGNDIKVIVVAVTGKGAKLVKNKVQSGFRNSDPILFDWDNEVSNQYGYTDKACMIVYVNKQGIVEGIEKGAYSEDKYNKFTEKLDEEVDN